jgi:hypothetical protein
LKFSFVFLCFVKKYLFINIWIPLLIKNNQKEMQLDIAFDGSSSATKSKLIDIKPGVVELNSPSTWKTEAGGSGVHHQPGIHRKIVS